MFSLQWISRKYLIFHILQVILIWLENYVNTGMVWQRFQLMLKFLYLLYTLRYILYTIPFIKQELLSLYSKKQLVSMFEKRLKYTFILTVVEPF